MSIYFDGVHLKYIRVGLFIDVLPVCVVWLCIKEQDRNMRSNMGLRQRQRQRESESESERESEKDRQRERESSSREREGGGGRVVTGLH